MIDEDELRRRLLAGYGTQSPGPWDDRVQAWEISRTERWVVHVSPMLFNNRVYLSTPEQVPYFWTAGWCYDKGATAFLAAMAFDPEVDMDPPGFKKLAADERRTAKQVDEINAGLNA